MEKLRKREFGCPFELLCEELYPEEDMRIRRMGCSELNCGSCCHYQGFHEGFNDLDEPDDLNGKEGLR